MKFLSIILTAVLGLAVLPGGCADSQSEVPAASAVSDYGAAARVMTRNLKEEMYFVDLIVRGTVLEVREPFTRIIGDVTPSVIEVEEVIHGDLDQKAVTLYQHGTPKTDKDGVLVSPGEEVILLLMETTEDFYWPYDPGAGRLEGERRPRAIRSLSHVRHGGASSVRQPSKHESRQIRQKNPESRREQEEAGRLDAAGGLTRLRASAKFGIA